MESWQWHHERLAPLDQGGDRSGDRWKLYDLDSNLVFATVIKYPGRLYRVFFSGGKIEDASTAYLAHACVRAQLHDDEVPRIPLHVGVK